MTISPATVEDVAPLCGLLAILFSQEVEFAPDAAKQAAGLRTILSDPRVGAILVVRENGAIVGMVSLLFTVSTFLGAKVALLEDMMVHPGQRGKGHGTRLLRAAIERAQAEGCARITLLTDGANAKAKAFYRRAGFVESTMTPLRLMLPLGE